MLALTCELREAAPLVAQTRSSRQIHPGASRAPVRSLNAKSKPPRAPRPPREPPSVGGVRTSLRPTDTAQSRLPNGPGAIRAPYTKRKTLPSPPRALQLAPHVHPRASMQMSKGVARREAARRAAPAGPTLLAPAGRMPGSWRTGTHVSPRGGPRGAGASPRLYRDHRGLVQGGTSFRMSTGSCYLCAQPRAGGVLRTGQRKSGRGRGT